MLLKLDPGVLTEDHDPLEPNLMVLKQVSGALKQQLVVLKPDPGVLEKDSDSSEQNLVVVKQDLNVLKSDPMMKQSDAAYPHSLKFFFVITSSKPRYFRNHRRHSEHRQNRIVELRGCVILYRPQEAICRIRSASGDMQHPGKPHELDRHFCILWSVCLLFISIWSVKRFDGNVMLEITSMECHENYRLSQGIMDSTRLRPFVHTLYIINVMYNVLI
jgi:hypothetical protein